jgi:hypothetical protein
MRLITHENVMTESCFSRCSTYEILFEVYMYMLICFVHISYGLDNLI